MQELDDRLANRQGAYVLRRLVFFMQQKHDDLAAYGGRLSDDAFAFQPPFDAAFKTLEIDAKDP